MVGPGEEWRLEDQPNSCSESIQKEVDAISSPAEDKAIRSQCPVSRCSTKSSTRRNQLK